MNDKYLSEGEEHGIKVIEEYFTKVYGPNYPTRGNGLYKEPASEEKGSPKTKLKRRRNND